MTNHFQDIARMIVPAIEDDTIREQRKSRRKQLRSWRSLASSKHIPVV
jgi:hypothetical protein